MNCNKFRILLSAYIDGELPEQEILLELREGEFRLQAGKSMRLGK